MIEVFYGWVELRTEYRDEVWYGWSITRDRNGVEVSRTQPTALCRVIYE